MLQLLTSANKQLSESIATRNGKVESLQEEAKQASLDSATAIAKARGNPLSGKTATVKLLDCSSGCKFHRGNITYKSVIDNLNVLDYEYYFRLTDCFLENKVSDALLLFNDILNKGFDGSHFITGLSSHFRDLLVGKDPVTLLYWKWERAYVNAIRTGAEMSVTFLVPGHEAL